jgi:hypothetical protein
MVNDLSNYFNDWTLVELLPGSLSGAYGAKTRRDTVVEFCVEHFGVQGGCWDILSQRDEVLVTTTRRIIWRSYLRFKDPQDALLFRLRFSEMVK